MTRRDLADRIGFQLSAQETTRSYFPDEGSGYFLLVLEHIESNTFPHGLPFLFHLIPTGSGPLHLLEPLHWSRGVVAIRYRQSEFGLLTGWAHRKEPHPFCCCSLQTPILNISKTWPSLSTSPLPQFTLIRYTALIFKYSQVENSYLVQKHLTTRGNTAFPFVWNQSVHCTKLRTRLPKHCQPFICSRSIRCQVILQFHSVSTNKDIR